ncbi:hypothetical protein LSCM1_01940 [Leishmania martiniquensis]|uniref:Uncharacterized protein n=1 Tax=Leishmania martiniquensis TaxID=1580590 RepID=A0A836GEI6_9TRYP|nr:hypothetical protein LSCM1_01940 [Leishmania martiniquensis]
MLSSSNHREDKPLIGHGTGSPNRVDAAAAEPNPPTSTCASSFSEDGRVTSRSCDHHSSSSTHPTSPWLDHRSDSTTSLDADDEADRRSPVNSSESLTKPLSFPGLALDYAHRQQTARNSWQEASLCAANSASEDAAAAPTTGTDQALNGQQQVTKSADAAASGANGSIPAQPLVRRRSMKRGPSSGSARLEGGGTEAAPQPLQTVPLPEALPPSEKPCTSSMQPANAATPGAPSEVAAAALAPAASTASAYSALPAQGHEWHDDSEITNGSRSFSPPVFPPSLGAATAESLGGSPVLNASGTPPSPLATRLRLTSRTAVELQHFGCCVFFFPAPFVSWLFPMVGHVAISNAEGSRLYTFESSYYVREEKLVSVLDRVLREEVQELRASSLLRETSRTESRGELSALPSTTSLRFPALSHAFGMSVMSDASASDTALTSPCDRNAGSMLRHSSTSSVFPSRSSARPPRRTGRSKSATGTPASGHAHTQCVRIWDLKPLLMESRGRRTRRTPCCFTTQGGKQAASVLWERLQELLQPAEASTALMQGAATTRSAASPALSSTPPLSSTKRRYTSELQSDDADGARSAPGMSSSSGEEEGAEYQLLDAETARFYNSNLHATIHLFRGSADGSVNSPDVVLQHHSSFSFVGFVLEACGVGSQGKPNSTVSALRRPTEAASGDNAAVSAGSSGAANGSATALASDDAVPGEIPNSEEIHWGVMKLLFHVSVFGKWHRGERRLWRVVHGGSIASAAMLWTAIIALVYHYFKFLFP